MLGSLRVWFLLAVLVVAGGVGGYYYYRDYSTKSAVQYTTQPLTQGNVTRRVTATGSLRAVTNTSVGSELSGKVVKINVDYNSKVHKGQLLALIDPSTFQAQVDQQQANLSDITAALETARANLQNARVGVPKARAGVLTAQANIESARAAVANSKAGVVTAEANVRRARAQLENSALNLTRQQVLVERNLVARSDQDNARSTYLQDRANLESLQSQVESSRSTYNSNVALLNARQADLATAMATLEGAQAQEAAATAQVQSAAAKVRQSQANLDQATLNLARTRITSPIDGIVVDRKVNVGQTVAAQFQAPDLFTLAENLEQMQVEVSVDEADIGQVKHGSPATFTVDSFPDDTFSGNVSQVRLGSTNVQGVITYTVIVRTSNPQLKLLPGMTATVAIQVATKEDVLLVPNAALRFQAPASARGKGKGTRSPRPTASGSPGAGGRRGRRDRSFARLYTLKGDRELVSHRVRLGISDGTNTEITEQDVKEGEAPLKAGDEVVIEASGPGASTPSAPSGGSRGMRMF